MIQAKCIEKFRDKQNRIYGYRLVDINGQTQDITPENLKRAIANNQIKVTNLTLSRDGRLMDTSEKQIESKELGNKLLCKDKGSIRIDEVIANKLVKAVNGKNAKCELVKEFSYSYDSIIEENFKTNICYKQYNNILLGVFIDDEKLLISINEDTGDIVNTVQEFSINISGGYKQNLKEIDSFINECANKIKV